MDGLEAPSEESAFVAEDVSALVKEVRPVPDGVRVECLTIKFDRGSKLLLVQAPACQASSRRARRAGDRHCANEREDSLPST